MRDLVSLSAVGMVVFVLAVLLVPRLATRSTTEDAEAECYEVWASPQTMTTTTPPVEHCIPKGTPYYAWGY